MKALKSTLAKRLLADPKTREQLRQVAGDAVVADRRIEVIRDSSTTQRYVARVVPKAA